MRVQDGLAPHERAVFRRGLQAGYSYLGRRAGRTITGTVEARLAHGDPCEPFLDPGRGATGMADDGWLCVDALTPAWRHNARGSPAVGARCPRTSSCTSGRRSFDAAARPIGSTSGSTKARRPPSRGRRSRPQN